MFGCMLIFDTITYAMKCEVVLKRAGFPCRIVKPDGEGGCKYAVSLSCNHIKKAIELTSNARIPINRTVG